MRIEASAPRRWYANVALAAGLFVVAIGTAVFIGWTLDYAPLESLVRGLATMKPNTAVACMLCGAALALRSRGAARGIRLTVANVAAAIALTIGSLSLAESLFGIDLGIDAVLFGKAVRAGAGDFPGRMSPGTAICFALCSVALLKFHRRLADWLALAVAVVTFVVLAGYGYSYVVAHRLISYTSFFTSIGAGVRGAVGGNPDRRRSRSRPRGANADTPGGSALRRLIPAAVIIPVVIAVLAQEGERLGAYEDPVGIGVMAAATIMTFCAVIWVTAQSIDASEAKRAAADRNLHETEASYRELFDSAPVGLSHSRPDGTILKVNKAFVELLGFPDADAMLRASAYDLYANPDDRVRLRAKAIETGAVSEEVEGKRVDGTRIWVQMHSRLVADSGGEPHFENALIDITARKHFEAQFVQAQKMEAVGRLAGGVAHDFNNLLTVIRSYCDLVMMEMPAGAPMRDDMREISGAADRAAALARQLLAFSRKQVFLPQVLDPNGVVQEVHSMLRRVLPSGVTCEMKISSDLGAIRADPGQVDQVLMNLAINASDAMPAGGRLLIETTNAVLDAAYARDHAGVQPGDYVCISVSDTGTGIDRETLAHIFEPFFTTKPVGKGTGLGLATVYGIVEQNQGHVWVYSEIGEGTTFKVYFPARRRISRRNSAPPDRDQRTRGGPGAGRAGGGR